MRSGEDTGLQHLIMSSSQWQAVNLGEIADDLDDENQNNHNDVDALPNVINGNDKQDIDVDLNDIRQKTLEYDDKQLKGVRFANAGDNNLKIANNHSVNSSTCTIT